MMNRRHFVGAAITLPFALRAMAATSTAASPKWVFLGTDKGKGIYRAPWNAATGELGTIELAVATDRPDFFAIHPSKPILYSVNSMGNGKGAVSGYSIQKATGELQNLFTRSTSSDGPCAISTDRTGRFLFAANYTGGTADMYRLRASGDPEGDSGNVEAGTLDCRKNPACGALGPNKDRQDAPHLHCATVSPDNRFVLVCNLGEDAIEVLRVDPIKSKLFAEPVSVPARAGSGPRHVAFHPNGKWVYCIHELDCTIDLYDWRAKGSSPAMKLRDGSVVATLAKGIGLTGNTGCEILVSDDGKFVYACTRGVDQITVYRVGPTGLLTEIQRLSCGGQVPRYIAFDPSRKWLVSCNQGLAVNPAGSVTAFARDAATGLLSDKPKTFAAETPMFVSWV